MVSHAQELWFFVGQGSEVSKSTEVNESTGVKINDTNPNQDMVLALTGSEGPLAAGAMPRMGNLSEAGEKNLTEALCNTTVAKAKKRKVAKPVQENAEEMTPKTPYDKAMEGKAEVLKCATEARKYALALEHINYSGELVKGLMDFSSKMENIYKKVTSLANEGCNDQDRYQNLLDVISDKMAWCELGIQAQSSWEARWLIAAFGLIRFIEPKVWWGAEGLQSLLLLTFRAENTLELKETMIPFLLPHEMFDALHRAGRYQDFNLKLIAVSLWSLHSAIEVMDFNDLILNPDDAEVQGLYGSFSRKLLIFVKVH
eukprot:s3204_g16.t1